MNIGILGGTFDPPHNGHLHIAESALHALNLSQVIFIPAKQPPHKLDDPVSPLEKRLAMLDRALAGKPDFIISLIETKREGPSYTVDTLRELRVAFGDSTGIYFIMGMDSLENLHTWHKPQEIVQLAKLAVLDRPGYEADLNALEKLVPRVKASVVIIPAVELNISSSEIRERVCRRQSIRGMVPPSVESYILESGLYRNLERC
jgi:nicotinate-nucleotide adenylyltransferase